MMINRSSLLSESARELSMDDLAGVDGGLEFRGLDDAAANANGLRLLGDTSFIAGHYSPTSLTPGGLTLGGLLGPHEPTAAVVGPVNPSGPVNPLGALGGPIATPVGGIGGALPWGAGSYLPGGIGGTLPNGFGGGQMALETQSFDIKSWGDPHNNITINGQALAQIDNSAGIDDYQTFGNTIGGPTTISTETTGASGATYNNEIEFSSRTWSMEAQADGQGHLVAVINDARGQFALADGQSVTEADGSVITNNNGQITVAQRLNDGGNVTTEIELNSANYIDMETHGVGNAMLSGWTADQFNRAHPQPVATGPTAPLGATVTNFPNGLTIRA